MKTQLRKVKFNKGVTDNGIAYDYTRIFVEVPIYDRADKEFGVDVLQLEFGAMEDHAKLLHLKGRLPVAVDVEWIPAKKGDEIINVVTKLDVLAKPDMQGKTSA